MTKAAPVPTPTALPPPLMSFLAASLLHLHLFISIKLFSGSARADFWMLLALLCCRLLSWNCLVCRRKILEREKRRRRNKINERIGSQGAWEPGKREKKMSTYPRSVTVLDRRRWHVVDWLGVARRRRYDQGSAVWCCCVLAATAARHTERVTDAMQLVRLQNKR